MRYITLLWILWGLFVLGGCDNTSLEQENTPVVGFSDTLMQVYENSGRNVLSLELTEPAPVDMVVRILVKSEVNVKDGTDFLLPEREIRVAKGTTSADVVFELTDDRLVNEPRSFDLEILAEKGMRKDSKKSACHIVILDNESDASVAFDTPVVFLREADETYYLPVKLQGTPAGPVKMTIEVVDSTAKGGVHFHLTTKEFVVNADFAGIPVTLVDDDEINLDRMFLVKITSVLGAMKITSQSTCLVTIRNEDLGISLGVKSRTIEEAPGNIKSVKIPIRLIGDPGADLEINVGVVDGFGNAVVGHDFVIKETTLTVPYGQDSIEVEVIPQYNTEITGDKNFRLQVTGVEGHEELDLSALVCDVTIHDYDTEVSFGQAGYKVGLSVTSMMVPVKLSQPVYHDIRLGVTPGMRAASDCEILTNEVVIVAGQTEAYVELAISATAPTQFGIALSPITGVSAQNLVIPEAKMDVVIGLDINKTGWTIDSFTSEEAVNDGPATAAKLIDGKEDTFWHSRWGSGKDEGPFDIVIDLHKVIGIADIRCVRRLPSNQDTKRVSFHLSDGEDKETWSKLGEATYSTTTVNVAVERYAPAGRYFKVRVEECNDNKVASLAEVYLKGFDVD